MKADPWENAEFQGISLETLWIASFYQLDIGSIHLPCDNIWFRIHKSTQRPVRLFSVSYTSGKPCTCKKKNQTDKQQQKKPQQKQKTLFSGSDFFLASQQHALRKGTLISQLHFKVQFPAKGSLGQPWTTLNLPEWTFHFSHSHLSNDKRPRTGTIPFNLTCCTNDRIYIHIFLRNTQILSTMPILKLP